MAGRRKKSKLRGRIMRVLYTAFGTYAIGYFPAYLLSEGGGPQISMVVLALVTIPFGIRSRGVVRGLLTGLAIGLWGGLWTAFAMIHKHKATERVIWVAILATAFICMAVCGLFAHMAGKRADRIEQQWH